MSVLKLAPNFAQKSEVLYKLAVIFGKTYQLDQAINYFKLATLESSGAPAVNRRIDILIKMGICYIEKKEYADALRSYEAALAMNDQNCRTLQHIAWCEFLMGKYTPALEHVQRAISMKESDGDGYYIKGRILLTTEKYPEAKEAFARAVIHNQSRAIYLASLGVVNCLTKIYTEAFENFLKATQLDQSIPEVWFDIGILYEIHQQFSEAVVAYQKAIEVAPDFAEAISRKQILTAETSSKPPLPQFVHPEFRVFDTMAPLKSFINNQKVKKASEPCLTSQLPTQSPNLITSIFNNIGMAPSAAPIRPPLLPPVMETAALPPPASKSSEEVKQSSPPAPIHMEGAMLNHTGGFHPHMPEEAKTLPKEEKKVEEPVFEPRSAHSEYHPEMAPISLMQMPSSAPVEKEQPKPEPIAPKPMSSQNVPRIPIPEIQENEPPHHAFQMPSLGHPQVSQPQAHAPPMKQHKQAPAPVQAPIQVASPAPIQVQAEVPQHYVPSSMPQGGFGPSAPAHSAQMQQMGLLSQLAQLQQQQTQLHAMLSSCGFLPQATNAYMQMMQCMQNPMMAGKMQPFVQTPTFGGGAVPGMTRQMQQMMGSSEMPPQYAQFATGGMPQQRMMGSMPIYGAQPSAPMQRNEPQVQTLAPPASYSQPTSRSAYAPQEPVHQYAPPVEAPQPAPKPAEPSHLSGATPAKPIPQHPKPNPGKLANRVSPISKRGSGLEDLIKVAVGGDKKSGVKPGMTQKPNVVTISFPGQHQPQGDEPVEERKQGESATMVKLAMSPQRTEDDPSGKRRRPEQDLALDPNAQLKKSKPDPNN